jgi:alpha-glucosidase
MVCVAWLQSGYEDVSRDFQRTPMQWSGKPNAGFSTANSTWLPVAKDYMENNVKVKNIMGFTTLILHNENIAYCMHLIIHIVVVK